MVHRALSLAVLVTLLGAVGVMGPTSLPRRVGGLAAASPNASPAGSPRAVSVNESRQEQQVEGLSLPEGIALTLLADGVADALPSAPARLVLERISIPAGADLGSRQTAGPELVYVETGAVVFVDESGLEGAYDQGGQLLLPSGISYGVRNDSTQEATLLRLVLVPQSSAATPPGDEATGTADMLTLLTAEVQELPRTPVRFFMARVTWDPGAELQDHTFTGPVGIVGEEGTLTVVGSSGIEAQLPPGKGVVFQVGARNHERNDGDDQVVTLVVGVVPADQEFVAPVATPTQVPTEPPTPSATTVPTVTNTPTPVATSTPSPTATAVPTATSTPTPLPTPTPPATGAVLYQADASGGFQDWELGGGWLTYQGMLINDGGGGAVIVPYSTGDLANYAVEVSLRVVDLGQIRGSVGGPASLGCSMWMRGRDLEFRTYPMWTAYDFTASYFFAYVVGEQAYREGVSVDPNQWHTYRIEIDGNRAQVVVDGKMYFSDDDNRLLRVSGGEVGIVCDNTFQVEIDQVRVIAGDNGGPAARASEESEIANEESSQLATYRVGAGAADWEGGWYRDDDEWYGRTWTAIYGAQSDYPRARVSLQVEGAPAGEATLFLTGIDDEWPGQSDIEVLVNDTPVFSGGSPFASWDGNLDNQGTDAVWTTAPIPIADGVLRSGENRVTVTNREPYANFSEPPYVLLSDVAVEVQAAQTTGDASTGGGIMLAQTETPRDQAASIEDMLPTADDVPPGFTQSDEGRRTAEQITATFPDPDDATRRFAAWGWQENAYRDFVTSDGSVSLEVSIHRFGSASAAARALNYLADARIELLDLEEVASEPLGDQSRAIGGGNEATLYVRRGDVVVRITVTASAGDPMADAVRVAQSILAK